MLGFEYHIITRRSMPVTRPQRVADEKRWVWEGRLKSTKSGLRKTDLMESKSGQIVSKKKHAHGKKMFRINNKAGLMAPPF